MNRSAGNYIKLFIVVVLAVAVIFLVKTVSGSFKGTLQPEPTEEITDDGVIRIVGSHQPGYYPAEFDFSLTCNDENVKIYYTVTSPSNRNTSPNEKVAQTGEVYMFSGGKHPQPDKVYEQGVRQTFEYTDSIRIQSYVIPTTETVRVTTIIAAAFIDNERVSDYYYYTFFVDRKGTKPNYSDKFGSYVASIIIDEENLYGYEEGIFIKGKAYEDELKNNPRRQVDNWFPRNYNQRGSEWEREARLQMFDRNGQLVIDQDVGLRISGGMSRHDPIKSFRIVARSVYDEKNDKIRYRFFENAKDVYGNPVEVFDKLVLRNGTIDGTGLLFRDVFMHKLGGIAGVDYQEGAVCTVYINGKYYFMMNLRESLDNDYIEAHYKIPKELVTMVSIASGTGYSFNYKQTSGPEEGLKEFKSDMKKMIATNYAQKDISEIEAIFDVDNFIKYMAFQMYIANIDWPHNNVLAWKYCGVPNESVYGMDGKWRFILKDLDVYSTYTSSSHNSYASVLSSAMHDGDPSIGQVFKSCIKNAEFRTRFKDYMNKLCTEYLTRENVNALVDELRMEREIDIDTFYLYYGGNKQSWTGLVNSLKSFTVKRTKWMLDNLDKYIR